MICVRLKTLKSAFEAKNQTWPFKQGIIANRSHLQRYTWKSIVVNSILHKVIHWW